MVINQEKYKYGYKRAEYYHSSSTLWNILELEARLELATSLNFKLKLELVKYLSLSSSARLYSIKISKKVKSLNWLKVGLNKKNQM